MIGESYFKPTRGTKMILRGRNSPPSIEFDIIDTFQHVSDGILFTDHQL